MNNFKIIYKILKSLERQLDRDDLNISVISAEMLKISFNRWEQLMIMLQDDGYIRGLVVDRNLEDGRRHIVEPIHLEITITGLEYLSTNSMMGKAKEALKMVGEII